MNILQELSKVNILRCQEDYHHGVNARSLSFWGNAIAGECGEMCNIIKKFERGDFHQRKENAANQHFVTNKLATSQFREELSDEIADIVIYLDLLCTRENIDLGEAIKWKFNKKSMEIGSNS